MWSTYASPGWILLAMVIISYLTTSFRINAGLELDNFQHLDEGGHAWRQRKYRVAKALQRISTLLLIGALVYAGWHSD